MKSHSLIGNSATPSPSSSVYVNAGRAGALGLSSYGLVRSFVCAHCSWPRALLNQERQWGGQGGTQWKEGSDCFKKKRVPSGLFLPDNVLGKYFSAFSRTTMRRGFYSLEKLLHAMWAWLYSWRSFCGMVFCAAEPLWPSPLMADLFSLVLRARTVT